MVHAIVSVSGRPVQQVFRYFCSRGGGRIDGLHWTKTQTTEYL